MLWFLRAGVGHPLGFVDSFGPAAIVAAPTIRQQVRVSEAALAGATTIKVDTLNATVPPGTRLVFSGGTIATTTAIAHAYSSSLAVEALAAGIAIDETASASLNQVQVRRVSIVMPAPTLEDGRPT